MKTSTIKVAKYCYDQGNVKNSLAKQLVELEGCLADAENAAIFGPEPRYGQFSILSPGHRIDKMTITPDRSP